MDMNASIVSCLKRSFSNTEIVTGRFHIVQHINRRFNQLRVQIINRFRLTHTEDQKKYRRLKRFAQRFHYLGATQTDVSPTF